jgi:hypothetical protein
MRRLFSWGVGSGDGGNSTIDDAAATRSKNNNKVLDYENENDQYLADAYESNNMLISIMGQIRHHRI